MRILFWYMFRQYAKVFFMCMAAVLTVYLVVDFFEKLRKFLKYDAELSTMLTYFVFRIPDICFQLAPLAALMATILTLGFLNRNHEITAMRSCGVSFNQIASPFLGFGILVSAILFSFTAVFVPLSNSRAEFIKTALIQKKPEALSITADRVWLRLGPHGLLKIGSVQSQGRRLENISLYKVNDGFQLDEIIESDEAHYTSEGWRLVGAIQRRVDVNGQVLADRYATLSIGLPLTPKDFRTWLSLDPKNMTLQQLDSHIQRLRRDGHSSNRFATNYWGRIAFSSLTIILTIFGLALSLSSIGTRTHAVAKGIGQALGIGFLFWVVHSFGIVLGQNGAILPIAAGWFASAMFFLVGVNLFLKVR